MPHLQELEALLVVAVEVVSCHSQTPLHMLLQTCSVCKCCLPIAASGFRCSWVMSKAQLLMLTCYACCRYRRFVHGYRGH